MAAVDRSLGRVYWASNYVPPAEEARRRFAALGTVVLASPLLAAVVVLAWPDLIAPFLGWWLS